MAALEGYEKITEAIKAGQGWLDQQELGHPMLCIFDCGDGSFHYMKSSEVPHDARLFTVHRRSAGVVIFGAEVGAIYDKKVRITPVFIDAQRSGHIMQNVRGFTYAPRQSRFCGPYFRTMAQCRASI